MRRALLALVAATALSLVPATAANAEPIGGAQLTGYDVIVDPGPGASALPNVPASAWVLADLETGAVLAAEAPHVPRAPASVLKALTVLTLSQRLDPNEVYTSTYDDVAVDGSRVGIVENATYTVRELFFGLMMQSGNDCARALAMANGGLDLTVAQMNQEAQRLQAYDTVAVNPSGLPAEGQVTSAYDLALIAREGLSRPDVFEYVNTRVLEDFPGYMPDKPGDPRPTMPIATQNPLFIQGYEGAIGVKTGWTTEAGRTFIGAAERDGTSLVVTLLNIEGEIYPAASSLLDWGFANIDEVTPVGYLVDPIEPMVDEAVAPAPADVTDGSNAGITGAEGADTSTGGTLAADQGAESGGISWAWVIALLGAMVVGLLMVIQGIRALRTPPPAPRRPRRPTPSDDEERIDAGSTTL